VRANETGVHEVLRRQSEDPEDHDLGLIEECLRLTPEQRLQRLTNWVAFVASALSLAGHPVAVASLEDVIRSKEAANRPKDQAALPTPRLLLRRLKEGGFRPLVQSPARAAPRGAHVQRAALARSA
jgi:hypothetical protein